MFLNYLKIAFRSITSQKYYSLINTFGLALGTAACILILLFVRDELSYEHSFPGHEKVYRIVEDFPMGNHLSQSATIPFPVKANLMNDFPDIKNAAIVYRPSSWGQSPVIKLGDEEFFEDSFVFAEASLLDIYPLTFIHGDAGSALVGPNKLVLTKATAQRYFGDANPVGQTLRLNNFRDLEVTGVVEDLPLNTHLSFDMLASFETFRTFFNDQSFFETQWTWVAAWMYFTVDEEAHAKKIENGLDEFVKAHFPANLRDGGIVLRMQRADDIHLTSNREIEFEQNGNMAHVFLFSFIALLILLIAVINFMNLATARATKRSREVGLRKVLGAHRGMLIVQFIGEATITSLVALVLALGIISTVLPWFNELTGKDIPLTVFREPLILLSLLGLAILVGICAGSYPSLVLSSFHPTEVMKGKAGPAGTSSVLRKGLVVCQFVISISLIICIGVVYKQLDYIHHKDMGFDNEQILMADFGFNQFQRYGTFRDVLLKRPDVLAVTRIGGSVPGKAEVIENAFIPDGAPPEQQQWFSAMFVNHDFEKVLNVEFEQGHSFQPGSSTDSTAYVINESAAEALGWGKDVVGNSMSLVVNGVVQPARPVIGLVKDFHYQPLYVPIKPLVIRLGGNTLAIKIQSNDLQQTVAGLQEEWNMQFPDNPFRYSFMDDNFDQLYRKEENFSATIQYFSVLAVFIACLGLLGLSSYTTESRRKEIGVRKVNGATTFELVVLLVKDFSSLIVIAFLIAVPVAWYFSHEWLEHFAYKTTIGPAVFLTAGLTALILAVSTVGYHTLRAARANPVNALRYE